MLFNQNFTHSSISFYTLLIEILKEYNISGALAADHISAIEDILVSEHQNPENNSIFRLYHFILNFFIQKDELLQGA